MSHKLLPAGAEVLPVPHHRRLRHSQRAPQPLVLVLEGPGGIHVGDAGLGGGELVEHFLGPGGTEHVMLDVLLRHPRPPRLVNRGALGVPRLLLHKSRLRRAVGSALVQELGRPPHELDLKHLVVFRAAEADGDPGSLLAHDDVADVCHAHTNDVVPPYLQDKVSHAHLAGPVRRAAGDDLFDDDHVGVLSLGKQQSDACLLGGGPGGGRVE
mmetsp:Transcript_25379/g.58812  ORF Transcript_25379/g.58812 Transcript_25379/m.58812 type:complete len:212 (-) Transcript_25379:108-743(-)